MNKLVNGQLVELTSDEETFIAAEEAKVKADDAVNGYKKNRANEYPSVVDQLDLIYHSGIDAWKAKIKETKDKYPKT